MWWGGGSCCHAVSWPLATCASPTLCGSICMWPSRSAASHWVWRDGRPDFGLAATRWGLFTTSTESLALSSSPYPLYRSVSQKEMTYRAAHIASQPASHSLTLLKLFFFFFFFLIMLCVVVVVDVCNFDEA